VGDSNHGRERTRSGNSRKQTSTCIQEGVTGLAERDMTLCLLKKNSTIVGVTVKSAVRPPSSGTTMNVQVWQN
jgi:hypothetical protein